MRKIGFLPTSAAWLAAVLCLLHARAGSGAGTAPSDATGTGLPLVSNDKGSATLRLFTYIRYINQERLDLSYTDAFGNTSALDRRQDIHLNKMNIQFLGWIRDRRLRYLAYVWTSGTSQGQTSQVVVGGNLTYTFSARVTLGGGISSLPGTRTTEGNFPYWLSPDNRMIADEFFRPSYTMGIWANGEITERLEYQAMLGNNLSQFGVDASQLDDGLNTVALALEWYPSTGEFGPRKGFGDFVAHDRPATRLAAHYTRSNETSQGQPNTDAFENVQIRLSDGNVIFKPGLFGAGIQIRDATYQMTSLDAAAKYQGYALEGEYFWRRIDGFGGPGVASLGFDALHDHGFQLQTSAMVMPRTVMVYASTSKIFGEYGDPWDGRLGLNWYPWKDLVVWWNFEYLNTHRSPVGGASLPYVVGGNGETFYTSFVVNF
jgi:hypothetical protein